MQCVVLGGISVQPSGIALVLSSEKRRSNRSQESQCTGEEEKKSQGWKTWCKENGKQYKGWGATNRH